MELKDIVDAIEYGKDKVGRMLIIITGLFTPGILTIFSYWRELFIELDWLKLLVLSVSISIPSLMIILFFLATWHTEKNNDYIWGGLGINTLVFGIALYARLMFQPCINMKHFVTIICSGSVIIVNIIHWIIPLFFKISFSPKQMKKNTEKYFEKLKRDDPEKYKCIIEMFAKKDKED